MITLCIIIACILIAALILALGAGGFLIAFGWLLLIAADIALGIWIIVKVVKSLFKKGGK